MPRIFITSGTSYTLPADFNPSNNTVECYGSGQPGGVNGGYGGGGGAYAKVTNINITPGSAVNIQIGSAGATDTWFNATSLANAVSNGAAISCGAQGASGTTGGSSAASAGTLKTSGGNGGSPSFGTHGGGGGGGGCGGPNGGGAWGGGGGGVSYSGAGGGGANNGSVGGNAWLNSGYNYGGYGGNGRGGSGAGIPGYFVGSAVSGGNGISLSGGGGGGGGGTGGDGALDDVYGDGVHGPGGGGGGGGQGDGNVWAYAGGSSLGCGAGGGGASSWAGTAGNATNGLIVITYVSAPVVGIKGITGAPMLTLRAPTIIPIRSLRTTDAPPTKMDWLKQPSDLLQRPPGKIIFRTLDTLPFPAPNPTPLYKLPWLQWPELLRHPVAGIDYRQQFPGKAPIDFFASIREGPDTISSAVVAKSPINAALLEYDVVVATVHPSPELGGSDDIIRRVKLLLPKGWWNDIAPIRDAIIGGIADAAAWSYGLVAYAKKQTRVAWATDLWLDIISKDYFKFQFPRRVNEQDEAFRARIQKELIRERVTRKGMHDVLLDLTGKEPWIFEPWNTGDTGAWDVGNFALDVAGGWGDTILPAQSFVNVIPPGAGIPGAPGWDCGPLAWDISGMWGDMNLIAGTITDQDIYDTINITRPIGSIVWTQLSAPGSPIQIPSPPTLTPSFAPPGMIQPSTWHPIMQQSTMPMEQIEGSYAVNPVTPVGMALPWLVVQPPIHRPAHEQTWEPQGFGGSDRLLGKPPSSITVMQPLVRKPVMLITNEPMQIFFNSGD